jgi:protein-tyrosine phosphatase
MTATKVVFVCLGNICRSPTAQGVFEKLVSASGKASDIIVDSAGTAAWHIGSLPDSRSMEAASQRGYDLSTQRARKFEISDFREFDYILAMDKENLNNLKALQPEGFSGTLTLFLEFSSQTAYDEVPDPYYGGDAGFELVLDLIEDASQGLLDAITVNQ